MKGETSKKPKGGNMGQNKVERERESYGYRCYYEKPFAGKERMRDVNNAKIEGEEGTKTGRKVSFSNVISIKCCNKPSLPLLTVLISSCNLGLIVLGLRLVSVTVFSM